MTFFPGIPFTQDMKCFRDVFTRLGLSCETNLFEGCLVDEPSCKNATVDPGLSSPGKAQLHLSVRISLSRPTGGTHFIVWLFAPLQLSLL